MSLTDSVIETGILPDFLIRAGIRSRLAKKLEEEREKPFDVLEKDRREWLREMAESPIALNTREANHQHYELPPAFFEKVLGRHLKYSSGYWPEGVDHLDQAEEAMLKLTVERAGLSNGQKILELGCGWGSLTLFMAAQFPESRITAVSNSHAQREFIQARIAERNLKNVMVLTADMNVFEAEGFFDRVVSVEMFEHMRNWSRLLEKISTWLSPQGRLFVHVFAHREFSYPYLEKDPNDWIAQHFFTGGMMPSARMFDYFPERFRVIKQWNVSGLHYAKTCRAWLKNMDLGWKQIRPIFESVYGLETPRWRQYWRIFFMACEELFAVNKGAEWLVSHTLLEKRK